MVTARCTSTLLHSAWSLGGIYPIYRLLDPLHKLRCWDESDFLEKLIASGCGTCERECPGYEYRMSQIKKIQNFVQQYISICGLWLKPLGLW